MKEGKSESKKLNSNMHRFPQLLFMLHSVLYVYFSAKTSWIPAKEDIYTYFTDFFQQILVIMMNIDLWVAKSPLLATYLSYSIICHLKPNN